MQDLSDDATAPVETPQLRFLRILVTVLTAVMIGGVVLIIALLVIRFQSTPNLLPTDITLPAGKTARAVTQGDDWYAIVTTDDHILIFDRVTGRLRQEIAITPAE
ncbi:MAG: DUF6476 family protein [Pseudomonadota bacterium]